MTIADRPPGSGSSRPPVTAPRLEFVFVPKGQGLLVMPVPELVQLEGIAKGTRKDGYRDRKDRY